MAQGVLDLSPGDPRPLPAPKDSIIACVVIGGMIGACSPIRHALNKVLSLSKAPIKRRGGRNASKYPLQLVPVA